MAVYSCSIVENVDFPHGKTIPASGDNSSLLSVSFFNCNETSKDRLVYRTDQPRYILVARSEDK